MELLLGVEISQGQAALLLGIAPWDVLQLIVMHQVPSGPVTAEEVREETESIQQWLEVQRKHTDSNRHQ